MTDSRPKDNIRLLMNVWLDELETKFLAQERGAAPKSCQAIGHLLVDEAALERWFVWRLRAFLQEHQR